MPRLRPMSRTTPYRARAALLAALVTLATAPLAVACGSDGGTSTGPASTSTTSPLDVVVATDPAVPIVVAIGRRFSIVLPADPGDGWRWVVQPFDASRLVALGSEFSDDTVQRMASTAATSTTSTTTAGRAIATSTTTTAPPDASTTTTTAMPPLVQIVSFAGRAQGTVTLSFRATQIVPTSDAKPVTVTWTVQVGPPTTTR